MGKWSAEFCQMKAWQVAFDVTFDVYQLSRKFPLDERFGLTDQVRRSSVSVPSSIAEGYARRYPKDKAYHYTVARSSAEELKAELMIARRLSYVDEAAFERVMIKLDEACRLIHGLIEAMYRKADGPKE
jgi:four helix bundle protein